MNPADPTSWLALLKENGGYGISVLLLIFIGYLLKIIKNLFDEIRKSDKERLIDARVLIEVGTKSAQALTNCSVALDLSSRSHIDAVASRQEFARTIENFEAILELNLNRFAERNVGTAELLKSEMGTLKSAFDTMRARLSA